MEVGGVPFVVESVGVRREGILAEFLDFFGWGKDVWDIRVHQLQCLQGAETYIGGAV